MEPARPRAHGRPRWRLTALTVVTIAALIAPTQAAAASPPVAYDDSASTRVDKPLDVFLTADDADFDLLTYAIVSAPGHGTLDDCTSGSCIYTPASGYIGADSFTWKANDGLADSNVATFSITVTANQAPEATDQSAWTNRSTTLDVILDAYDTDGDDLAFIIVSPPTHGALDDCSSGSCIYTPASGYIGADSFTWKANDGLADSNVATFSITVVMPTVTTVTNNAAGAAALAAAVIRDPSSLNAASFESVPTSGTPNGTSIALDNLPTDGSTFGILTSGDASLADDPNTAGGSGADIGGGNVRGDTDYDVTILRLDLAAPAGSNCLRLDFAFYSDEYPEFVGSRFNDGFIAELDTSDWTTSGSDITAPSNFAFDPQGEVVSINSTGDTSMTAAEALGTTYDGATKLLRASKPVAPGNHSLYLSIFDQGDHVLDSAVFVDNVRFVTVQNPQTDCAEGAEVPVNKPPVAADDAYTTAQDTAKVVNAAAGVLANDSDPDGDSLTVSANTNPAHGTLSIAADGSFTYTPAAGYCGADSFTYTASDGKGGSDTATVALTVTCANKPPSCTSVTVSPDSLWPPNHGLALVSLSGGTDPDGDALTITITGVVQNELVAPHEPDAAAGTASNQVFLRAERTGSGSGRLYAIAYAISDGRGGSCTGTVTVSVSHDQGKKKSPPDPGSIPSAAVISDPSAILSEGWYRSGFVPG